MANYRSLASLSDKQRVFVAAYWALCHAEPLAEGERLPTELAGCLGELSRSAGLAYTNRGRLDRERTGGRQVRARKAQGMLAT